MFLFEINYVLQCKLILHNCLDSEVWNLVISKLF